MRSRRIRRTNPASSVSNHPGQPTPRTWSALLAIRRVLLVGVLLSGCQKNDRPPTPAPPVQERLAEIGLTIVLEADKAPDPLKASLEKHSDVDHCRWQNMTSTERKIHLRSGWPFMEDEKDIIVPAYGLSAWYSLEKSKASKDYPYEVSPSLADGGAREQPSIGVGD